MTEVKTIYGQLDKELGVKIEPAKTHEKFIREYGGKVFYIFSSKVGERKEIVNKDVIDEIRKEIERLGR